MSKKIDINENELRVLSLFSHGYDREYYIREICTYLPISHGTAQTILAHLEKKCVLASVQRGKTRIFRIKPGEICTQYFILTEMYKKICFMEEKPYISEVLNKINPCTDGITALFGSYAKGTDDDEPDIDIFVAGHYDEREIADIEKKYDIEINILAYPDSSLKTRGHHDPVVIEMQKNHIVWKNIELFVRAVMA